MQNCLVFAEKECKIPDEIVEMNTIVLSENPQLSYVKYVEQLEQKR